MKDLSSRSRFTTVRRGDLVKELRLIAPVSSDASLDIHSAVEGRIKEIFVAPGGLVKKGDKIAAIDDADALSDLEEARLMRELAECDLEQVAKTDSVEGRRKKISLEIADVHLRKQERKVERYQIYTTESGRIAEVNVNVGDYVAGKNPFNPGTKIASIVGTNLFKLRAMVSERDVSMIRLHQQTQITLDAIPGLIADGEIVDLKPSSEQNGGAPTFPILIEFTSLSPAVKLGMTATATIRLAEAKGCLYVPISAVRIVDDRAYIQVWTNDHPKKVEVHLGLDTNETVEITGAVSDGDKVVLD